MNYQKMHSILEEKNISKRVVSSEPSSWEHMFRAYDIRGIYGKDMTPQIAEKIGMALGTFIGTGKELAVGRDIRIGSEQLKNAVVKGLVSTGCKIDDLGIVTTPILYFTIAHKHKDGGVMVTASHNPPEWNGLKLCREKGLIIGEDSGMEQIKNIIKNKKFIKAARQGRTKTYEGIVNEYARFVLKKISIEKKLKVVLDTGNSVPAIVAPMLFKQVGCKVTVINEKLDGTFPSRSPEPTEESLQQLISVVKKTKADFGVGYDADGDRAVFADDLGRVLTGDFASIIFAQALITKEKRKVVYDVSCSSAVEETIKAKGGVPIVERVGRPFMMDRVLKEKAVFGGESSGHFYFPEIYGLDDGAFTSLKMAEILSKLNVPFSQIVDSIPKYHSSTMNVPCPDEIKFNVIEHLKTKFQEKGFQILDIDGVKAQEEKGWVLMRASNTQPIIRITAEGKTQGKLTQLLELAKKMLKEGVESVR
jgi:phosphomannomutase/phosphoglucomutase